MARKKKKSKGELLQSKRNFWDVLTKCNAWLTLTQPHPIHYLSRDIGEGTVKVKAKRWILPIGGKTNRELGRLQRCVFNSMEGFQPVGIFGL